MKNKEITNYIKEVIGRKKLYIIILILLQSLLGICGVLYAAIIKEAIDFAVEKNRNEFFFSCMLFVLVVVGNIFIAALIRFFDEYSRASYENAFKSRLFLSLLISEYKSVTKVHSGEWMNRLTSDTVVVAEGLTGIVPGIFGMLVRLLGAVAMLLIIEPRFAIVVIPGGIFMFLFTYAFRKVLKRMHKRVQEADGTLRSSLQEYLASLIVIKTFGAEGEALDSATKKMEQHKKERMRRNHFSNVCNIGFASAMRGAYVLGLIYSGYGIIEGTLSYGTLIAILQLISQIQNPFANISGYVPKFYAMIASVERLYGVESFEKDNKQPLSNNEIMEYYKNDFGGLSMNNVSFKYTDTYVLKDFSIEIHKGEMVAITGCSGCGKSTALKILLGIYEPTSGEISVDFNYKRLFAYVPQGNYLMSGTVREVISFANSEMKNDIEKINKAMQIACCDFVYDMTLGIDTIIGEKGFGLSEGQMQRLAIARAVFSENPVLILDESTGSLDSQTERKVLENIKNMTDKTVIIVTHRDSVVKMCDRRFEMISQNDVEL